MYTITSSKCMSLWSLTLNKIKLSVFPHALLAHNISYPYSVCVCLCVSSWFVVACTHQHSISTTCLYLCLQWQLSQLSGIGIPIVNTCITKFSPCISNGTPCIVIITCLFIWFCQQDVQSFIFYTFFVCLFVIILIVIKAHINVNNTSKK